MVDQFTALVCDVATFAAKQFSPRKGFLRGRDESSYYFSAVYLENLG